MVLHSTTIGCNVVLTLLYWILLMSSVDCEIPGKRCLSRSKMVAALSSNNSLFSRLTLEPHDDFP